MRLDSPSTAANSALLLSPSSIGAGEDRELGRQLAGNQSPSIGKFGPNENWLSTCRLVVFNHIAVTDCLPERSTARSDFHAPGFRHQHLVSAKHVKLMHRGANTRDVSYTIYNTMTALYKLHKETLARVSKLIMAFYWAGRGDLATDRYVAQCTKAKWVAQAPVGHQI